jgi:hypothetical protein
MINEITHMWIVTYSNFDGDANKIVLLTPSLTHAQDYVLKKANTFRRRRTDLDNPDYMRRGSAKKIVYHFGTKGPGKAFYPVEWYTIVRHEVSSPIAIKYTKS